MRLFLPSKSACILPSITLLTCMLSAQVSYCDNSFRTRVESEFDSSYDQLADEYAADVEREKKDELVNSEKAKANPVFNFEQIEETTTEEQETTTIEETSTKRVRLIKEIQRRKELYEQRVSYLYCNDPWFWNSFECVWLDLKNQNIIQRTKDNAKVAAIFGGVLSSIVLIPICGMCIMRACISRRAKAMENRANEIMDKARPGVFVHPDGTRHYYDPTPEEEEAFMDLLIQMATIY